MKKIISFTIILFFMTKTYSQEIYRVTAESGLNIRKESSIKSEIIGKILFGTKLETIKSNKKKDTIFDNKTSISGEWIKVDLSQFEGIKTNNNYGYLFNGFLKLEKPYISIGHIDKYNNLPKLEFEEITEDEFNKTFSIKPVEIKKIEKNDSHFTIKTKNQSFTFKIYKDYKENGGWSGSEYKGYYPEFGFYAVQNNFTSDYLGFGQLILIDSITDNIYDIISIGDGAVEKPISSPKNDYLIYYYNFIYGGDESCFIGLIKINEQKREIPKMYLTEYKSFNSKKWKIEEIKWSDNYTCIIKGYTKTYENEKWVKHFKYYETKIN
ncbi:SH3 domain-containing protein [Cellulophaga sp. L1A9]|uniref:SH3 domain-containing protein n=1 Tax=Cellulophaga sp. L1A9 TaxID=2686362 RepID=UPI00131CCBC5|nr:SH3 domain-containing protein [Cellulophaga sp. L1A9]